MSRAERTHEAAPPARFQQTSASFRRWWAERPQRERRLLKLCAALLSAAVVWWLGMGPAIESISRSEEQLPRLRYEAAQLDALLIEAQTLNRRSAGKIPAADVPRALNTSLQRAGVPAKAMPASPEAVSRLRVWEIRFDSVSAAQLMEWLGGLSSQLPLTVVSVDIARAREAGRDRPGQITGRILLETTQEEQP